MTAFKKKNCFEKKKKKRIQNKNKGNITRFRSRKCLFFFSLFIIEHYLTRICLLNAVTFKYINNLKPQLTNIPAMMEATMFLLSPSSQDSHLGH